MRTTDTTKRRSDATGASRPSSVVAALEQRHVHGVDLVVGGQRRRRDALVAAAQDLAHALEVLVDPDAHELDLQPDLVELVVEARCGRERHGRLPSAQPNRPVM